MPSYLVSSDSPIHAKEVDPEGPEVQPPRPGMPRPPEGWEPPTLPPREEWPSLPPREEWPPLPPWFDERPGQGLPGLPIPPGWGHPSVPLPPIDPDLPDIWPPLPGGPGLPDLPDFSGKTLALITIHVSRKVHFVRWAIIDHEAAKGKLEKAKEWLKAHWPAGGIGRPPQRPGP